MKSQRLSTHKLAGIQYLGLDGITSACIKAITLLISGGELIKAASLITCDADHAFLLYTEYGEVIAVKAGFSSGYLGEGPRGLATALAILHRHNVEVEEYRVAPSFMHRLSHSCLLESDLDSIKNSDPVRPSRWYDYVYDQRQELDARAKQLSRHYPRFIPFGLIDERLIDLAVAFISNEDATIISAYRRLEDIVRKRTGLAGEGTKLFSKAFLTEDAPLRWDVPDEGESKGRATLFNATYMAFRNARVHRELAATTDSELREFLLINELYRLEAESLTEIELKRKREEDAALDECMAFISRNDAT